MKKYISLALIWSFCLLAFSACESYLEEMPQNKLMPTTTDDYDQLLNNAYITERVMPYLDILSDDVELIASNHVLDGEDEGDWQVAAYMWRDRHDLTMSGGDLAFEKLYESIYYCNVVIENIGEADGVELNEENVERTRKNIEGEARCLRAYSYFYLVNLYAMAYDPATCATDPGVPINNSTAVEDKAYPRNTVAEVYEQIVSDLTKGIQLLKENPIEKGTKVKFNELSATAFLARVYLYMQNGEDAIVCAKEVVASNRALFDLQEYGDVLNMENNTVTEWNGTTVPGTDYLSVNNSNILFVNGVCELYPALQAGSYTTFSVSREFAGQYEEGDIRRFYFMVTYANIYTTRPSTKLTYAKSRYVWPNAMTSYITVRTGYGRFLRTEEMYLILAEAYARQNGGMGDAIGYLNTMRRVKFKTGEYVELKASDFTQETLLDYIAVERRRELCFEGHRWFDLRRTTRPEMQRVGYNDEVAHLDQNDPRYVLQIPQKELSVNPSIGENPR